MNGPLSLDVVQHRLGLGCARLGSVLGRDRADALKFIRVAFDRGIRFFDTASIYGQGESERILGAALCSQRKRVTIVTKAGQYFPTWMRVVKPLKDVIGPLIRQSGAGQHMVAKLRESPLPQNFSDSFLRFSIEGSLRRLNTDHADIILLHSPTSDVIANGDALGSLAKLRDAGKAIKIGISCEDVNLGFLALDDPRVDAIELPLWPISDATDRFLDRARRQAVFVIGRGLMRAPAPIGTNDRWPAASAALISSLQRCEISRVLIGTTRLAHLDQVLNLVRGAGDAPCS
jgi:aryl-alcohol dehydrogenase-like predicted oxidoreductase